jgi:signal transduction histidine kinase
MSAASEENNIRDSDFPKKLTLATVLLTFIFVGSLGLELSGLLNYFHVLQEVHIPLAEQSIIIFDLDERMTNVAHLKISSADGRWDKQYEIFRSGLDLAADQLIKEIHKAKAFDKKINPLFLNRHGLINIETAAFETLARGDRKKAYELLVSDKYQEEKTEYKEKVFKITSALHLERENQLQGEQRKLSLFSFLAIILAVPWSFLIRSFIKTINNERQLYKRERVLLIELKKSQQLAVTSAHEAGMSEIATGILHNVGNVLNSTNVSVETIIKKLDHSVVDGLYKANNLLEQNINSLSDFLTINPKGKKLMNYYLELGVAVKGESDLLKKEASDLMKRLNLIKDIINTQQTYAKGSAEYKEQVSLIDIAENAIMAQSTSLIRHEIKLLRKFSEVPLVFAQKTKLVHVILNLVKNAKEAMSTVQDREKIITIEIGRNNLNKIFLSVTDTGQGVERENLTKIFSHGFTTKQNGHGFGLHFCANATDEMDAKISAASDGLEKGTSFIIEFNESQENLKSA